MRKQQAQIRQLELAATQAEQVAQMHAAELQRLQQQLDYSKATASKSVANSNTHTDLASLRQQLQEAHAQIEALQQQHATAAKHEGASVTTQAASGVPSSDASTPTKAPQAPDAQDPATVAPSDKEQVVNVC